MQLSTDMSGDYNASKDPLQRDLIAIQRIVNDLQNQVKQQKATIAALQTRFAAPATTIAPNGQVAGLPGSGLQTVAHDATLFGLGTPSNPLRANTALILNGVTASPVLTATFTLANKAALTGLGGNYAAGTTLVSGVANKHIVPLYWNLSWVQAADNASAPWTTIGSLRLGNNTGNIACAADMTGFANAAFDGEYGGVAFGSGRNWSANIGNNTPYGNALKFWASVAWVASGASTMTLTGLISVAYVLVGRT